MTWKATKIREGVAHLELRVVLTVARKRPTAKEGERIKMEARTQ